MYSEPCQKYSVLWKQLTIFSKHSILDSRQDSQYASDNVKKNIENERKKGSTTKTTCCA